MIVEKPAGVTTVRHSEEQSLTPRRRQLQPTFDELVRRILARKNAGRRAGRGGKTGRGPRVRAVHRLDRDSSGLVVFALTAEAERRLVQLFRKHAIHRVYHAIVRGRVEAQTFASHLVRDRGDGRRGSTTLPNLGKRSVTHVRPIEFLNGYTLIGMPAGDRADAPDSHSPGRGGPSGLRREGLPSAAFPPGRA